MNVCTTVFGRSAFLGGLFVLATLVACEADRPQPLVGTLERDRIELAAYQTEPLSSLLVEEGEFVRAGDVVAQLDTSLMDARLDEARANHDAAAARLAELARGPRAEKIAEARAELDRVGAELERAEQQYQRIRRLRTDKLVSQSEMDEAVANRNAGRARREEAAARLESLLAGTTVEELERARADARAAEARIATLERERARLIVRSPVAGWIDALPYATGERVPAGAPVAVVLDAGTAYARVYLPEHLRADVEQGGPAKIHIDGAEKSFSGRVRFISNTASFTPFFALTQRDRSRLSYLTEVEIDVPDGAILPVGVPVEVRLTEQD